MAPSTALWGVSGAWGCPVRDSPAPQLGGILAQRQQVALCPACGHPQRPHQRQRSRLPVARRRHAHNCKQTKPAVISGVTHSGGDQTRRSRRGVTGWRPGWAASEPGPAQTHVGGSFCVFPATPASRAGCSQLLAGAPAAMITLAVSRQFSHYCRARDRVSQMLRGSGGRDPEGSHGDGWTCRWRLEKSLPQRPCPKRRRCGVDFPTAHLGREGWILPCCTKLGVPSEAEKQGPWAP